MIKIERNKQNTFYLHLKECEFRFNYKKDNLYRILLKMITCLDKVR